MTFKIVLHTIRVRVIINITIKIVLFCLEMILIFVIGLQAIGYVFGMYYYEVMLKSRFI